MSSSIEIRVQEETLGTLAASEGKAVELNQKLEKAERERPDHTLKAEIERLRAELCVIPRNGSILADRPA